MAQTILDILELVLCRAVHYSHIWKKVKQALKSISQNKHEMNIRFVEPLDSKMAVQVSGGFAQTSIGVVF